MDLEAGTRAVELPTSEQAQGVGQLGLYFFGAATGLVPAHQSAVTWLGLLQPNTNLHAAHL